MQYRCADFSTVVSICRTDGPNDGIQKDLYVDKHQADLNMIMIISSIPPPTHTHTSIHPLAALFTSEQKADS